MPPARKGSKPGDGTCDVCHQSAVLTSVCEATGKAYCRGVYACRLAAGVKVKGTGLGAKKKKRRRTDGSDVASSGASGGQAQRGLEAQLTLKKPEQIISHRLFDAEPLHTWTHGVASC